MWHFTSLEASGDPQTAEFQESAANVGISSIAAWLNTELRAASARVRGKDANKAKVSAPGFLGFGNNVVAHAMRGIHSHEQVSSSRAFGTAAAASSAAASRTAAAAPASANRPNAHSVQAAAQVQSPPQPDTPSQTEMRRPVSSLHLLCQHFWAVALVDPDLRHVQLSPMWEEGKAEDQARDQSDNAQVLVAIACVVGSTAGEPDKRLNIAADFTWQLFVNNQPIDKENLGDLLTMPETIDSMSGLHYAIQAIKQLALCPGVHSISQLMQDFIQSRGQGFGVNKDKTGQSATASFQDGKLQEVRSATCTQLCLPGGKSCGSCTTYRHNLSSAASRWEKRGRTVQTDSTSNCHRDLMDLDTRNARDSHLRQRLANAERREGRLTAQLSKCPTRKLPKQQSESLGDLLEKMEAVGEQPSLDGHPSQNFHILVKEQLKRYHQQGPVSTSWHPAVIKWALAIHGKSPAAYEVLSKSGFLRLPHARTLQKYVNVVRHKSGVPASVEKNL